MNNTLRILKKEKRINNDELSLEATVIAKNTDCLWIVRSCIGNTEDARAAASDEITITQILSIFTR